MLCSTRAGPEFGPKLIIVFRPQNCRQRAGKTGTAESGNPGPEHLRASHFEIEPLSFSERAKFPTDPPAPAISPTLPRIGIAQVVAAEERLAGRVLPQEVIVTIEQSATLNNRFVKYVCILYKAHKLPIFCILLSRFEHRRPYRCGLRCRPRNQLTNICSHEILLKLQSERFSVGARF